QGAFAAFVGAALRRDFLAVGDPPSEPSRGKPAPTFPENSDWLPPAKSGFWYSGRSQRMIPLASSAAREAFRATTRSRISASVKGHGQPYASATAESRSSCSCLSVETSAASWIVLSFIVSAVPARTFSRTL